VPQIYTYKARNASGSMLAGKIKAGSQNEALSLLRSKNIFVLKIKPESPNFSLSKLLGSKIKLKDMSVFCRQFAAMNEAGVSIMQCLSILAQQTESQTLRWIIQSVVKDVEKGTSLSEAFRAHKDHLPEIFINMIIAGEVSGKLDQTLGRLATHFEKDYELREKVKSAMTYPLLVAGMAFASMIVMMIFVVPIFVDIFSQMGAQLPLPTRILIFMSDLLIKRWYLLFIVAAVLFFASKKGLSTNQGKMFKDRLILKLPIAGKLAHRTMTARFARTLGTLLKSGVPIMQSLDTVSKISGNTLLTREINKAREKIREGERMAPIFLKSKIFTPMTVNMIAIGEESGSLDDLLEKLAVFYEQEVESLISRLSSTIEPLLITGVGIIIGFMALSIYMPLFGLSGALQGGAGIP